VTEHEQQDVTNTMATTITVRVMYFAKSREAAGTSEEEVELAAGSSTKELLSTILVKHPGLESVMRSCVLALNQEYLAPNHEATLKAGDEVAIIPPLSGG
jgi:molybdopterin converting factor subunit 1